MSNASELTKIKQKNRTYLTLATTGIIVAVVFAGLFFWSQRPSAIRNFENPYPLLDPARSFISQEHYITTIQPLREKLRAMVTQFGNDSVSIYVEYLNTGANISINPQVGIWPASLAKVPLAMAVMKKIEAGGWKLANELVLMPGDADDKSGDSENPFSEYPVGTRFTIERLLKEMLVNSDNTAYYILKRNLHKDELNQIISDLGLEELFSSEGRMSAKEYSRIFRALYVSSFLKREHSQMILQWLDESPYEDFLSYEVGKRVPFPHKYGENIDLNVYSDSGIVYISNRPYLITVMVEGNKASSFEGNQKQAARFMRDVSQKAYDYFSNQ